MLMAPSPHPPSWVLAVNKFPVPVKLFPLRCSSDALNSSHSKLDPVCLFTTHWTQWCDGAGSDQPGHQSGYLFSTSHSGTPSGEAGIGLVWVATLWELVNGIHYSLSFHSAIPLYSSHHQCVPRLLPQCPNWSPGFCLIIQSIPHMATGF